MKTIFISLLSLAMAVVVYGQEHPTEHPTTTAASAEHTTTAAKIDKHSLAASIEHFVMNDSAIKGGAFLMVDDRTGKALKLRLEKVHKERLSNVGNDTYFACADFRSTTGKTYDLDFFMTDTSAVDLRVTEITVHKENGKERYTWSEARGVWKKKAAK